MIRKKRVQSTSPEFAVRIVTWDDETGAATKIDYDDRGNPVRRAVVERFPRERWQDDIVGEAVWYDGQDCVVKREPVLLGRTPDALG